MLTTAVASLLTGSQHFFATKMSRLFLKRSNSEEAFASSPSSLNDSNSSCSEDQSVAQSKRQGRMNYIDAVTRKFQKSSNPVD